jgi:hypothetical protein
VLKRNQAQICASKQLEVPLKATEEAVLHAVPRQYSGLSKKKGQSDSFSGDPFNALWCSWTDRD